MNKNLKLGINVALLLLVVVIGIGIYNSITNPIRFRTAFDERSEIVKTKLIKIRDLQLAYLDEFGHYSDNFDSLVDFAKNGQLTVVKSTGVVPDSIYLKSKSKKEAEMQALKLGIITRDTIKLSVKDSLFKDFDPDTLMYIPYTKLTQIIQLNAGKMKTVSKSVRPVFELRVHNNSFTEGIDKQQVINLNDAARVNDLYPGLILGSMTEVSTSGNWN
jgi:hypothetical protein